MARGVGLVELAKIALNVLVVAGMNGRLVSDALKFLRRGNRQRVEH